jgi:hypothetical protein
MKFRHILQAIARRGILIIRILIIGIGVLLVWFLASGFSPSAIQVTIGIAAISAFLAAISSFANLLQAVETERQRRNQERPYINAYFDASSNSVIYFVVQNSGNAPATNVKLSIEPAPIDYAGRKLNEVSFFSQPISFLPAGKIVRQLVGVGHQFLAKDKPVNFEVEVEYSSTHGEFFKEKLVQNLDYLRQTTGPGKSTEDNLAEIVKELSEIKTVLKGVERFGAIQIETPQEHNQRVEQMILNEQSLPWWRKRLRVFLKALLSRL